MSMSMPKNMPPVHPEAELRSLVCGSCQWYMAGFEGDNCQRRRGVEVDTPACQEYTIPMEDPFYEIIRDKYIQRIRREIVSERFKIDSSIIVELRSYIQTENLNKYKFGTQQDLEGINTFVKKIIYYRARVSNIYTSLLDVKYDFDEVISHANLWLYSKYPVVQTLKNETARRSAFQRIMPEMIEVQKDIDKNLATAKYIDDYLDSNERA